jgi:hypothetical protein
VHLNGTAPSAFLSALREAGIHDDRVTPTQPDLQTAIRRTLAARAAEQGDDR